MWHRRLAGEDTGWKLVPHFVNGLLEQARILYEKETFL